MMSSPAFPSLLSSNIRRAGVLYKVPRRPKATKQDKYHQYQLPFLNRQFNTINISPVGSGKTVMMLSVAADRYANRKSTVVLAPKNGIISSFRSYTHGKPYDFWDGSKRYKIPTGVICTPDTSDDLCHLLENDFCVPCCSYQKFINAYDRLSDEAKANLLVIIDEAHHSSADNTELGGLVRRLFNDVVPVNLCGRRRLIALMVAI